MRGTFRTRLVAYLIASTAIAAAVLLRWLVDPVLGAAFPLVTLFGAVAIAVWFGGYRPALAAAAVGYVACSYFFIEPRGILGLSESRNAVGALAYALTCALIIGLGEAARMAQGNSRRAMQNLRLAFEAMQAAEHRSRTILESISDSFFSLDREWRFVYANPEAERLLGRAPGDLLGKVLWDEYPGTVGSEIERMYRRVAAEQSAGSLTAFYADHDRWYEIRAYPAPHGMSVYFRDVTQARRIAAALRASEERRLLALDSAELGSFHFEPASMKVTTDERFDALWGSPSAVLDYQQAMAAIHPDDRSRVAAAVAATTRPHDPAPYAVEHRVVRPDGTMRWVFAKGRANFDGEGPGRGLVSLDGTVADITARKEVQELLRLSEERFRALFNSMDEGFCVIEMIFDAQGQPVDYRFDEMNPAFTHHTGLHGAMGRTVRELGLDLEPHWLERYGRVASTGQTTRFVDRAKALEGRWFDVCAFRLGGPESRKVAILFNDITERRRHEEQLRHSERRLRMALSAARMLAWEYEPATGAVAMSDDVGELFGLQPGTTLRNANQGFALVHPDDVERHRATVAKAAEERGSYVSQFRLIRPVDHGVIWLEERGHALHGAAAEPVRLTGVVMDITARKLAEQQLREADQQFRILADNMPQLAWIADAGTEGEVRWFNKSWLEYTGATIEAMQGAGWRGVHHPDHAERVIGKFAHHVKEGLDWEDTFPLRGKDGRFRWFLSRMNVIRDGSGAVARIFGTNTDITEQLEMAARLERQAADLADSDRRKDEFLATLAHELRNPLAPIRNSLELIRLTGHHGKTVEQARLVMERQLTHMVRLVDDLLDVSRISSDKVVLRRQRVELSAVVASAVETSAPLLEAGGLALTIALPPEPIPLDADLTRLAQVFGNLLNNAAKFTERGGHITLSAVFEADDIVVTVKDTGIGIEATELERIFEMFSQLDSSLKRSQGGLGIGLTLVRRFVELHGGRIVAHSEGQGRGSEFTVRLPVAASASAEPLAPEETEQVCASVSSIFGTSDKHDAAGA